MRWGFLCQEYVAFVVSVRNSALVEMRNLTFLNYLSAYLSAKSSLKPSCTVNFHPCLHADWRFPDWLATVRYVVASICPLILANNTCHISSFERIYAYDLKCILPAAIQVTEVMLASGRSPHESGHGEGQWWSGDKYQLPNGLDVPHYVLDAELLQHSKEDNVTSVELLCW